MKELFNKITYFFKLILTSLSGISSKRFCGLIAWISIIGIFIYCSIENKQAPYMVETFMICSVSLLGIDSITSIWKHKPKKKRHYENYRELQS